MFRSKSGSAELAPKASGASSTAAERQKAARATATQIKQLQESALKALPERKLYIGLWLRDDPPTADDFHWGFYYHKTEDGGTKYHMKNLGAGWIADHGSTGGVFKSQFLCVLIEIGGIPADKELTLDQIMRSCDASANTTPGFTCRTWVFSILQRLIEAGLLRCTDLAGLQRECLDFGNEHMRSARINDQPRPVRVSARCS